MSDKIILNQEIDDEQMTTEDVTYNNVTSKSSDIAHSNDRASISTIIDPTTKHQERKNTITLISSDDIHFQVPKEAVILSGFIKDTLGCDDDDDDDDDNDNEEKEIEIEKEYQSTNVVIHVLRVRGIILKKIIEFLLHYIDIESMIDIPTPFDGNTFHDVIKQEYYYMFIHYCLNEIIANDDTNTITKTATTISDDPLSDNDDVDTRKAIHTMTLTNPIPSSSSSPLVTTGNDDMNHMNIYVPSSNSTWNTSTNRGQDSNEIHANQQQQQQQQQDDVEPITITTSTTAIDDNNISSNNNNNNNNQDNIENRKVIFELLAASNYMSIKPLQDLICLWITFQLQGKNQEQIRVFLHQPQITPEEEAKARNDHPWIFESS